jgi:hypothetical protein
MNIYKTIDNTTINTSLILSVVYIPELTDKHLISRYEEEGIETRSRVAITYTNGYQHSVICSPEQYNTLRVMVLRSNDI